MNALPVSKKALILSHLVEGNSIRSIAMITITYEVNERPVKLDDIADQILRGSLSVFASDIHKYAAAIHCPKCSEDRLVIQISQTGVLGPQLKLVDWCHLEFYDLVRLNLPPGLYLPEY